MKVKHPAFGFTIEINPSQLAAHVAAGWIHETKEEVKQESAVVKPRKKRIVKE